MKRKISSLLAAVMLVTFAATGCQAGPELTAGSYTGVALGRKGEIVVEVQMDDSSITNIEIVSHRETPVISDETIAKLPQAIVDAQSLEVDTFTGATITAFGVKNAVRDAIEQAGGDIEFFKTDAKTELATGEEVIDTDYAIAGAGLTGLMSAITAAEEGKSVVVFEELSYVGGAMHCAAGVVAGAGSDMYEGEADTKYSSPELYAEDRWINQNISSDSPEAWTEDTTPFSLLMHRSNTAMTNELIERGVAFESPVTSVSHIIEGGYFKNTSAFAGWLEEQAIKAGVTFVKDAEVTELIMDGDAVVGLKAVSGEKTYTVNSDAVLIATGGWNSNDEMVRANFPAYYDGAESSSFYTVDGSSLELTAQAGGQEIGMDLGFSTLWVTAASHIEVPFFSFYNKSILVDANGERFANEYSSYRDHCELLLSDESHGGYAYFVWDEEENPVIENGVGLEDRTDLGLIAEGYKSLYELGDVMKFDNAAAASEALGVDLTSTIDKYNAGIDTKEDEFGNTMVAYGMASKLEEEIYVCKILPSVYVSYGGVEVDMDMHVLNANGEPIKGLYAAGDAIGAPERQEGMKYTAGVTVAMSFGKLAAETMIEDFAK